MATYRFAVRVERHADGHVACCDELQGCCAQGDTFDAAMAAIRNAVRLHVEDRLACGEEIPQGLGAVLTAVEVTA